MSLPHFAPGILDNPAPLSFPAILRNPGIQSRFAHLAEPTSEKPKLNAPKKRRVLRHDNDGKRWVRRRENARFTGNVHIVQPGKKDLQGPAGPILRSTFPEPLPVYLARNNKVPTSAPPTTDPKSEDFGRFSLSLKGMRRELRKMGFRSQLLVLDIEAAILQWLDAGGIMLSPDEAPDLGSPGVAVGNTESVVEISRTPLQIIWKSDDAFARYVVHCTARYHKIVSFSKDVSGQRLTYLLRPNVHYPVFHSTIDTPPATDIDLSSQLDTDSEFASDFSDAGDDSGLNPAVEHMATIQEDPSPTHHQTLTDEEWSDVGGDESEGDAMVESTASLSIDPDETFVVETRLAQLSLRSRSWTNQPRSTSSPSRSPERPLRRTAAPPAPPVQETKSFYEYLFS
ncbi:hypothetical protein FB45DRAFT_822227 [Roridomyces roridus]|uniref:Uncharacterized protein n=1 Tax=Roridomyces roridus TaxID=1738132 RepID=A0AAD7CFB0_9AGAR|nr:hypothetical protein FB45DRAFT_822227 [Roridomyces roridus]